MSWTVSKLKSAGFDRSEKDGGTLRPRCSQCEVLVIQGVPTHERGCPNQKAGASRSGGRYTGMKYRWNQ